MKHVRCNVILVFSNVIQTYGNIFVLIKIDVCYFFINYWYFYVFFIKTLSVIVPL
jgi:hypothetical protein